MKTHPRHCRPNENPCTQEHTYICAECGNTFETHEDTHFYKRSAGVTYPSMYWPECSLHCYKLVSSFSENSNPMGLTWNDLDQIPDEGIDPSEPIDFQDPDYIQWDSNRILNLELEAISDEIAMEQAGDN